MRVIFRIMSAIKGKGTFAQIPVNVFYLVRTFDFTHNRNIRLNQFFTKHGRLAHKTFNHINMILRKHGRYGIVLGRKFEQRKIVRFRIANARHVAGRHVDIGKFVNGGIRNQFKVLKSKCLTKIQLLLIIGIDSVSVKNRIANIGILCRQGNVQGIGGRTHGK